MNTQENIFENLASIVKPETELLSHLQGQAINAHRWTSFSPERRGEQMIKDYSEELASDMEELKEGGANDENIADYKNRYEKFFSSYISAKSRTFSAMITGPANFPVRRHEKANRGEQRHYEVFREWRKRAIKAIIRKAQPAKTFTSEIERYRAELASMQVCHEKMKQANKMIVKAKKNGTDISEFLIKEMGVPAHMVLHTMQWGFGTQNNNANMKRVEGMIKQLESKEAMRNQNPVTNYTFEGGKMVIDYDIDRIKILFDSRPNITELADWKSKGLNTFNWSPSAQAWQRKITPNALNCVKYMLKGITKVN